MKRLSICLLCLVVVGFCVSEELMAQRRGGGGGGRAGGGMSRPMPSRPSTPAARPSMPAARPSQPAMSRPAVQPGVSRPAAQPGMGARPGNVSRPSVGTHPSQSQLQGFLGPNQRGATSTPANRLGPTAGAATGGGAAGAFLQNNQAGADQRPGVDNRADRADNRMDNRADRADTRVDNRADGINERPDRVDNRLENRQDRIETRPGEIGQRPERIENRQELVNNRVDRRGEVRNQFLDNHPRYDFWQDNPNWARFRFNRPYRWATWGALGGWFGWGGSQPVYSDYGSDVYYEGDTVYMEGSPIASTVEYTEQAQTIATSAPEPAADSEWMPLGVFALTEDGQASGPAPTTFLQLAVNKEGVIAGSVTDTETNKVQAIEGMVDPESQRSAWVIEGEQTPIMETSIANLTKDEAPALLHLGEGKTQQLLMVRLEDPEGGSQ